MGWHSGTADVLSSQIQRTKFLSVILGCCLCGISHVLPAVVWVPLGFPVSSHCPYTYSNTKFLLDVNECVKVCMVSCSGLESDPG